ncbi:hypothetical protein E5676_scaffold606G001290 [Cucumis melo var. makuwa]|uniref:Uncharacterized protein n=1 Tax=Cucumis melo var. makuwa TaxID=1194695 RepID=A0A5A7URM0_CUCMM|nr:hypothetical protein E6C27_scaffold132G001060 [Cucumis melo var. makuwa]TYK07233.1 hypothetical protein E5676_scaffold606G001290 [Cucumis melo var. makuwa]
MHSSFGEVTLPSAIQLLLGDDRALAVRSTVLALAIRSTTLVGAIGHLRRLIRWRQSCTIDVVLEKQRRSCTFGSSHLGVNLFPTFLLGNIPMLAELLIAFHQVLITLEDGNDSLYTINKRIWCNPYRSAMSGQPNQVPKPQAAKKPQLDVEALEANNSPFFSTEIKVSVPIDVLHKHLHVLPLKLLSTLPFQDIEERIVQENDDIRDLSCAAMYNINGLLGIGAPNTED